MIDGGKMGHLVASVSHLVNVWNMWGWTEGQKDETKKWRRFAKGGQCVEVTAIRNSQKDWRLVKRVRGNTHPHQYPICSVCCCPLYFLSKLIAFITHPGIGHECLQSSWPSLYMNFSSTLCIQTPNPPVQALNIANIDKGSKFQLPILQAVFSLDILPNPTALFTTAARTVHFNTGLFLYLFVILFS